MSASITIANLSWSTPDGRPLFSNLDLSFDAVRTGLVGRNGDRMKLYSDSVWFWRISEGVPNTKMKPWKSKLSEEDRWKILAFERSFGLSGKGWDTNKKDWVPADQVK